jgi:hypothetical protein
MKNCQGVIPSSNQEQIQLQLIEEKHIVEFASILDSLKKKDVINRNFLLSLDLGPLATLIPMLEKNLNPYPLRSLLRIFLGRHESNLAIMEDPYIEVEFWDTFSYFHSRSFFCKRKQCWRIHFFKWNDSLEKDPKYIISGLCRGEDQEYLKEKGFDYLGFTTIRPTTSFNVGRTAVIFADVPGERAEKGEDPLEQDGIPYCKGKAIQIANVGASKLSVDSVAFLQQDPIVGMCATASLWIASQVLASKFDLHKYPYIDISRQATQPTLTPFVFRPADDNEDFARGLSVPEICGAMIRTGAIPLVITPRLFSTPEFGNAHLRDQLYTFVESELPVIVCLQRAPKIGGTGQGPGHAITAIGHLHANVKRIPEIKYCTTSSMWPDGSERQFLVSLSIIRFYVHNDNYGPFDRMDFINQNDPILNKYEKKRMVAPVKLSRDDDKIWDIKSLVIPIPPYVKNRPDAILKDVCERFKKLFGQMIFSENDNGVIWRTLLVKGSGFKQSLVERKCPTQLIESYAKTHLPKYIWLCEFTITDRSDIVNKIGVSGSDDDTRRMIDGEFIYDTTTANYDTRAIVQRLGAYFVTDNDLCNHDKQIINKRLLDFRIDNEELFEPIPCYYSQSENNKHVKKLMDP